MVNTVESYRSPIRLIGHAAEDAEGYSAQAINRARKKLMAEIALSGDEIVIDGVPYSRNDASALLDGMTEEGWKMHSIVYAHEGLLAFLEKEEFNDDELKKADAYLYNEKFVQAVSPYFAHSFNTVSGRLLKEGNFVELIKLQNYSGYILPEHGSEGYQKIRTYLDDLSYTLRNLSWEKFIADESILHFAFSDSWKVFINKLPSSFTTMRDDIVEQLINIVLRFQHKATWHYLHQMLEQLKKVETNDFNRFEIIRIDKVIYRNSQMESKGLIQTGGTRQASPWQVLWWAAWATFIWIKLATCADENKSPASLTFQEKSFHDMMIKQHEKRNEQKLVGWFDSLSKHNNLSIQPQAIESGDQPFRNLGEDTHSVQNDSIVVVNKSDCDAVYFYFKDWPGHSREGVLPKIYSTFVKSGEAQKVYVLPNNGRIYFAFGKRWGQLKKALQLTFLNDLQNNPDSKASSQNVTVDHFFKQTKGLSQTLLQNPIYIDNTPMPQSGSSYHSLNDSVKTGVQDVTKIFLSRSNNSFFIKAVGRLTVSMR